MDTPEGARPFRFAVRCVVAVLVAASALPLAVVSGPTAQAAEAAACQVRSDWPPPPFASGFDIHPTYVSSTGVYRVAVLFADFPDAPATATPQEAFAQVWTDEIQDYFSAQSHGRLSLEVVADDTWRRMDNDSTDYDDGTSPGAFLPAEAITKADPTFDFSGIDSIWVVHEITAATSFGEYLRGSAEIPYMTVDDTPIFGVISFGGLDRFEPQTPELDRLDLFIAHEAMHTLGLLDHYNGAARAAADEVGQRSYVGNFDIMAELGGFEAGVLSGTLSTLNGSELMAWHRWQLGWIDDDQVICISGAPVVEFLTPLSEPGGVKALMVPLDEERVVVAELRTRQGYDRDMRLEGVLVYVVDTRLPNASGTIEVLGPFEGDWASSLDLLQPGESQSFNGARVDVLDAGPEGYEVSIRYFRCGRLQPTINLNLGDSGIGTPGDDVILGTDGDDFIDGRGGNDLICGGKGADTILGGDGDDRVFGQDGDDVLRGNAGNDRMHGGHGSDRLLGGIGEDVLQGEDGDDYIGGFGGSDRLYGGLGSDTIFGGFGPDRIRGGPGDDVIRGLIGDDSIDGDEGNDVLEGDRGNDRIDGGDGDDRIGGGNANDILNGGPGDDIISGGRADDVMSGGDGIDECAGNRQVDGDSAGLDCEAIFGVP